MASLRDDLEADLRRDEAWRSKVYDDATGLELKPGMTLVGQPTIGFGRNLVGTGISTFEGTVLLGNDIVDVSARGFRQWPWLESAPEPVQRGLLNMAFNQGVAKVAAGSPKMIAALQDGRYADAAAELEDGPYIDQVGDRGRRIASLFRCAQGVA